MSHTLIQSVTIYYVHETNNFKLDCINGTSISGTIEDYAVPGKFIRYSPDHLFGPKPRKEIWRISDKDVSYDEMLAAISAECPKLLDDRKQTILKSLEKAKELAKDAEDLYSFRETLEEKFSWNSHQIQKNGNLHFELSNGCRLIITPALNISIKDNWGIDVNHWLRINQPSLV